MFDARCWQTLAQLRPAGRRRKTDVLIRGGWAELMEWEQTEYDNAHMKGRPFKLRRDMKDSPSSSPLLLLFIPPLSPLSLLLTVSLLYIQAQTVNANKAFSHTELMYPVHFTNVLPFKCHLLCCCREYISTTGLFFFFFLNEGTRPKLPSAAFAKFIYWQTSHDAAF